MKVPDSLANPTISGLGNKSQVDLTNNNGMFASKTDNSKNKYASVFDTSSTSNFGIRMPESLTNTSVNGLEIKSSIDLANNKNNDIFASVTDSSINKIQSKNKKPFEPKQIFQGNIEIGKLQTGFSTEAHEYNILQLLSMTNDNLGEINLTNMNLLHRFEVEGRYKLLKYLVLSEEDNIEDKVINAFLNGSGLNSGLLVDGKQLKALIFDKYTSQSKKLKDNSIFKEYYNSYLTFLTRILSKDLSNISQLMISNAFSSGFQKKPNFSQSTQIPKYDYYGLMGGVQKVIIDLNIKQIKDNEFNIETRMALTDWYGADWGDINGIESPIKGNVPGLVAFFWLQHHYGCKPFATQIIYESEDVITTYGVKNILY